MRSSRYIVAIVGGATAGAEAAGILADRGVLSVVFEQNPRPYGKIEDGLPRWHVKLREKEYREIDARLSRPEVHFVPRTKIGRDIEFPSLVRDWGFTAVVLAHGAWRDRPFPVEGADEFIGKGLVYQNSFIYWFNHFHEKSYAGPRYEVVDGAAVVGGGLASIDVLKALQIENARQALAARGIQEDVLHLEHAGIPATLTRHGLSWDALGLQGATLYYRRRVEDMPLADAPPGADRAKQQQIEGVRRKILEKAMQKYLFHVRPQMVPVSLRTDGDRLTGLEFQPTRLDEGGRAVPLDGNREEVRAPLIVSSIGSIPEPLAGIEQNGHLYRWADERLGRLPGYENVFSIGNVVTGKGNIADSRRHSIEVTAHLVERFLGLNDAPAEDALPDGARESAADAATRVADWVRHQAGLTPAAIDDTLARVREQQRAVGYGGSYPEWIARVMPEIA